MEQLRRKPAGRSSDSCTPRTRWVAAGRRAQAPATAPGGRREERGPAGLARRWGEVAAGPGAAAQEGLRGALMLEGGLQRGEPAGGQVGGRGQRRPGGRLGRVAAGKEGE